MLELAKSLGPKGDVVLRLAWEPPLEMTTSPDTWAKIAGGELTISVAYMQGKLKVVGSSGVLMDVLPELDAGELTVSEG